MTGVTTSDEILVKRNPTPRSLAGVMAGLILLGTLACAKDPTRPRPIPIRPVPDVDEAAVWSHDGQHIAFHRRFQSADGPPGVYFVSKWGGTPRLLAPGDFWWPKMLSFSPDDRYLVGISNFVMIIIDIKNATVREPLPPGIGAYEPDWSPRADAIIYWRWPGFPATPDDSAGLYFLDPWSGNQRIFLDASGQKLYGSRDRVHQAKFDNRQYLYGPGGRDWPPCLGHVPGVRNL
ncbi:MAG: hypothetical protein E6K72_09465 [Candidatus Eisenbacteria bacterium]|uniref:Dipeptidylpeptidase IV N-terminal domain-containing protein n=1 Tax=Eiseniibacteriota bacterium TaxID=2212470 RepID=A0A538SLG3_UNCEI|nr:MAG: hypothetical protein E6K72_09465 [Candidatus Eisenbacteria bacterium]